MKNLAIRFGIVGFWVLLLVAILYWPTAFFLDSTRPAITIFAWGDILNPTVIEEFAKSTGIKVHLNYYSSNEELLVKLKATKGRGYDLIIPSDYAVKILSREGLLRPLDRTKLDFWPHLNPLLLDQEYDPGNHYSVPFAWEIFGLGIDTEYFEHHPYIPSWRLIFDETLIDYKIGMTNDPHETILLAAFYLYGADSILQRTSKNKEGIPNKGLTDREKEQELPIGPIRTLLTKQRDWVAVYADFRADYLLATRNCPVVVASSSYIWRTMRQYPFIRFILPQEGTFITVENIAIPASTTKAELVYRFINFLYRKESIAAHFTKFGFFPSTTDCLSLIDIDGEAKKLLLSSREEFAQYQYIEQLLPEDVTRDILVEVKTPRVFTDRSTTYQQPFSFQCN